jgi:hypothetical protein
MFGEALPAAPSILHRYNFATGANDLVGTADGTLQGGAYISSGQVILNGTGAYVQLPAGIISPLTSATFETWVTWNNSTATWARIWDFGVDTTRNMFLTVQNGNNFVDPQAAIGTPRFAMTIGGNGSEQQVTATNPYPLGLETDIAVAIDAFNSTASLYINGVFVAQHATSISLNPSNMDGDPNNYLGKSQYPADPFLQGSIDEFRIYNGAMTTNDAMASYLAGPDVVPEPSAVALLALGGLLPLLSKRFAR